MGNRCWDAGLSCTLHAFLKLVGSHSRWTVISWSWFEHLVWHLGQPSIPSVTRSIEDYFGRSQSPVRLTLLNLVIYQTQVFGIFQIMDCVYVMCWYHAVCYWLCIHLTNQCQTDMWMQESRVLSVTFMHFPNTSGKHPRWEISTCLGAL